MKYVFVAEHRPIFSIRAMCRCLSVQPSGFYAWLKAPLSRPQPNPGDASFPTSALASRRDVREALLDKNAIADHRVRVEPLDPPVASDLPPQTRSARWSLSAHSAVDRRIATLLRQPQRP